MTTVTIITLVYGTGWLRNLKPLTKVVMKSLYEANIIVRVCCHLVQVCPPPPFHPRPPPGEVGGVGGGWWVGGEGEGGVGGGGGVNLD